MIEESAVSMLLNAAVSQAAWPIQWQGGAPVYKQVT